MPRRGSTAVSPGQQPPRSAAVGRANGTDAQRSRRPDAASARRSRPYLGILLRWTVFATIWGLVVLAGVVIWAARDLPRPESAMDAVRRPALVLQDRANRTFATYGDLVGEPMRLADLPPELPEAVVAVEDHRFWRHSGIDFVGQRGAWEAGAGRLDDHATSSEDAVSDE